MNNENEMDWSEEETNYEEDLSYDIDNCQTNKFLSDYEDLKLAAKNIGDKLIPYNSDSGYDRLKKEIKRKTALKNKVNYILNNCEKFGFNQTNKIILEHAIDEVIKPKAEFEKIDFSVDDDGDDYDWVVKGLGLCPGDSFAVAGEPFTGKTHFASYLAVCISAGIPVFGKFPVDRKGGVAHINYDSDGKLTKTGYRRMAKGLGVKADVDYYEFPTWKFNDDIAYENLTKICTGKALCIVDSLRACFDGAEDTSENSTVIALANKVSSKTNCAILFIAHPGKGGVKNKGVDVIRGTSSIGASVGTLWTLEKMAENHVVKFNSTIKARYGGDQIFCYRYEDSGEFNPKTNKTNSINMTMLGDAPVVEKKLTIREQVVAALKTGSLSSAELNDKVTGNHASKYDEYTKMEKEGHLKIEQKGKSRIYSLTDGGAWL